MKESTQLTDNKPIDKKCVIYFRVSRNTQSDLRQERDVLEYCQKNGYVVQATFREKISGTKRNRPEMQNAILYLNGSNIKFLLCSELSRLGRSNEVNDIVEDLAKHNICVITLKESIQTMKFNEKGEWVRDDDKIFLVGILTAINKKESDTIGYRISSGKRNSVMSKGGFTGGKFIPYGYESKYIDENSKGILMINDKEAELIKHIFTKFAEDGWGNVKIANWLNLNNYPTRTKEAKWQRCTINNILNNPIYKGERLYKGETIKAENLRIVSDVLWDTAHQRKQNWKNDNQEFSIKRKYEYLFDKRIIKCGVCGKHYFGLVRTNDGIKTRHYKCTSGKYDKSCGNPVISMDWLELKIQHYIAVNAPKLIYDNTNENNRTEKLEIDLTIAKAEQQKQKQAKERFTDAYAMGNISKAKYDERIDNANLMIDKLQEQITVIEQQINANKITETQFIKGIAELQSDNTYKFTEFSIDKAVLHKLIKQIVINKGDKSQTIEVMLMNGKSFELEYNNNIYKNDLPVISKE